MKKLLSLLLVLTMTVGIATVTVTVYDEYGYEYSEDCTIEVTFAWWQWLIYIFLLGFIWY